MNNILTVPYGREFLVIHPLAGERYQYYGTGYITSEAKREAQK